MSAPHHGHPSTHAQEQTAPRPLARPRRALRRGREPEVVVDEGGTGVVVRKAYYWDLPDDAAEALRALADEDVQVKLDRTGGVVPLQAHQLEPA